MSLRVCDSKGDGCVCVCVGHGLIRCFMIYGVVFLRQLVILETVFGGASMLSNYWSGRVWSGCFDDLIGLAG
jgi:hypothetical protein